VCRHKFRCRRCAAGNATQLRRSQVQQPPSRVCDRSRRSAPRLPLPTHKLWQWHSRQHLRHRWRRQPGVSLRLARQELPTVLRVRRWLSGRATAAQVSLLVHFCISTSIFNVTRTQSVKDHTLFTTLRQCRTIPSGLKRHLVIYFHWLDVLPGADGANSL